MSTCIAQDHATPAQQHLVLPRRRSVAPYRICATPTCEQPARRRGRQCTACSLRAWRRAHRDADRAREAKRSFTPEQRLLRNARATVAMAIKRGLLLPQACLECSKPGLPHHTDPSKKLDVLWLCREHRRLQQERDAKARALAAAESAEIARKRAWEALRERFAAEWELLPSETRNAIQERSQATPIGRLAPPGSPLAKQALVQAFGEWQAR